MLVQDNARQPLVRWQSVNARRNLRHLLFCFICLLAVCIGQRVYSAASYTQKEVSNALRMSERVCTAIGGPPSSIAVAQSFLLPDPLPGSQHPTRQIRIWEMDCGTDSGHYRVRLCPTRNNVSYVKSAGGDSRDPARLQKTMTEPERQFFVRSYLRIASVPVERLVLLSSRTLSTATAGPACEYRFNTVGKQDYSRTVTLQISKADGRLLYLVSPIK